MKKIKYYASVAAALTRQSIQSRLEYPFMLIGHVLANCVQWVVAGSGVFYPDMVHALLRGRGRV